MVNSKTCYNSLIYQRIIMKLHRNILVSDTHRLHQPEFSFGNLEKNYDVKLVTSNNML